MSKIVDDAGTSNEAIPTPAATTTANENTSLNVQADTYFSEAKVIIPEIVDVSYNLS